MPNARSIHIGLNYVDPDAYNGWDGELFGCINDANDMQSIADGLGYSSTTLIDSDATSCRVISEIGQAADELSSGDILFLTYSGHGSQVDDVNGEEDDVMDETWCLWDRELVDDELYCLWSRFSPGVRIVVLSDSCHSGTMVRMMKTIEDLTVQMTRSRDVPTAEQKATLNVLAKAAGIEPKELSKAAAKSKKVCNKGKGSRSRNALAATQSPNLFGIPRCMPPDVQMLVNRSRAEEHAAAQWLAGPAERAAVGATVILISGCQDNQLSSDGSGNGLFTQQLKEVWNDGAFSGNYSDFWSAIKDTMPAKQQPNYLVVGANNDAFEAQSPFEIGDGSSEPAEPTDDWTDEPTEPEYEDEEPASAPRPTLRQGSKGDAVLELQQMLSDLGYNVSVDGNFGPGTASAVRSFQNDYGLDADGVVGQGTWDMLESMRELEPA